MNLTTLANTRQWLNTSTDADNALLMRLISEASRTVLNYLQRPELGLQTITETISGKGTGLVQLRNWPILEVNSVTVDTVVIPPRTNSASYGYFLEPLVGGLAGRPQNLRISGAFAFNNNGGYAVGYNANGLAAFAPGSCRGRPFTRGVGNILVDYTYGYCTQDEAQTVPATPFQITPSQQYGSFSSDLGVVYANGTPLVAIASGTPAVGQYVAPVLTGDNPTLYYQFAAADAGAQIQLNYNFVPYDLEQATIELIGERYKYRGRIGEASRSQAGQQTASYMVRDTFTAAIKGRLNPYRLAWSGI